MQLPTHYTDSDLACKCGCGLLPTAEEVERFLALCVRIGYYPPLTSVARCKEHNKRSGGRPGSLHLPPALRSGPSAEWAGQAWDIGYPHADARRLEIVEVARSCGYNGIGFYKTFLHIDSRQSAYYTWQA